MFLFCNWFSSLKCNEEYRKDIDNILEDMLNQSEEE